MIWLLQLPAVLLGFFAVTSVIAVSVGGLILFRKAVSHTRLEKASGMAGDVFQLAGVLYAVLVAFVVVVVWEQFGEAENATAAEASAIADLLRDSTAIPPEYRLEVRKQLVAYTEDVINDELPRMRRGETIEEESDHMTALWSTFLKVEPKSRNEIAFFDHDIVLLNELSHNRKLRVSTGESAVPGELWVLLIGGGAVVMGFTFLFGTRDLVIHAVAVGLTAGLMGFVMYLIFALEHPFVGALSVKPDPYVNVLQIWREDQPQN